MRWFRFYTEALNDPKVQRLPAALFRQWISLLCIAAEREGDDWGTLPPLADLAYQLRKTEAATQALLDRLVAARLIDYPHEPGAPYRPHNWDRRQYKSDDVTARVKRHREQDGNVARNGKGTPPDNRVQRQRAEADD